MVIGVLAKVGGQWEGVSCRVMGKRGGHSLFHPGVLGTLSESFMLLQRNDWWSSGLVGASGLIQRRRIDYILPYVDIGNLVKMAGFSLDDIFDFFL